MPYKIQLPLPQGWISSSDIQKDEDGSVITHLECQLPDDKKQTMIAMADIYVGPMPEDSSAADQAYANYVDMIGFDEDDPEDMDPITEWPFNGRKAYGFEGLSEDDSPIRVMAIEIKKGVLCIMSIMACDDDKLVGTVRLIESKLRVSA